MIIKEKRIVLSAILALLLLLAAAAIPLPASAEAEPAIYDDGWELEIDDVDNLTIRAEKPGVEIVTVPRYACVMKFDNCRALTLEGFTCGHTDGAGFCTGAVINLTGCRDVSVTGCDLYGCGTYGLEIDRSRGVHALNTTIRDCSYGALWANAGADILLDNCTVYGIEGYSGIFSYSGCRDCAVINTLVRSCASSSLMETNSSRNITLAGCEVSGNTFNGMACSYARSIRSRWTAAPLRTIPAPMAGTTSSGARASALWTRTAKHTRTRSLRPSPSRRT